LHRLARSILRNDADAEDAVQRAHMLALRHLDQYAGRSTYIRWMSAITVHEAITQIRRSKNTRWNIGSDGLDVLSADVRTPEQLAITQELAETLEAAQHLLPSKYWVVFRLREVESLSESETAAQLGITRSCVRIRLFRARVLLRDVLSDLDVERKRFPCSERTIVGAPAPT
jgi:RNA polymerase sigma-70 factor (ECF subfamily)